MAETSSPQPLPKRVKYDLSQSFDVLVGPEKKRFTVPRDILIARSGFFEAARSPRWNPDPSDPTDLSDHDPQEFSDYLEIVYTGGISFSDDLLPRWVDDGCPGDRWGQVRSAYHSYLMNLARAYVLADKLQDPASANVIINNFINIYSKCPKSLTPAILMWIYQHTPPESPMRKLAQDATMYDALSCCFDMRREDEFPNALLLTIIREQKLLREKDSQKTLKEAYPYGMVANRPKCYYHQHNDKHPKCK